MEDFQKQRVLSEYSLKGIDLFALYDSSKEFRRALDSGKYFIVENTLCLCSTDCVNVEDGQVRLDSRVYSHPEDYLLRVRNITRDSIDKQSQNEVDMLAWDEAVSKQKTASGRKSIYALVKNWLYKFTLRKKERNTITETVDEVLEARKKAGTNYLYEENKLASTMPLDIYQTLMTLTILAEGITYEVTPAKFEDSVTTEMSRRFEEYRKTVLVRDNTFGKTLEHFMNQQKMTVVALARLIGVDEREIRRYRKDEYRPGLPVVVAICIALHLDLWDSNNLIESAWYHIPETLEGEVYRFLLRYHSGDSIAKCNAFLKKINVKPLTRMQDSYNEAT